jgi:hypothetical protein
MGLNSSRTIECDLGDLWDLGVAYTTSPDSIETADAPDLAYISQVFSSWRILAIPAFALVRTLLTHLGDSIQNSGS